MEKNKKIWGVFNTFNKGELDNLSEFEIWSKIYSLNKEITSLLNYLNKGYKDVSLKALINEEFNLDYLIYYTRKFGVIFDDEPTFGEHIKKSESFNLWYEFWNNHFKSMNLDEYRNYIKDKSLGLDITKYMPIYDWKDSLINIADKKELKKVCR